MFSDVPSRMISVPLLQAIEDAVLLGNIKELDGVLELAREEENFPEDLRYSLESLRYFREHYGKGGDMSPRTAEEKTKMLQMEKVWSQEILEALARYPELSQSRFA